MPGERQFGFLDVELASPESGLTFVDVSFARLECLEPLLELGLAPRKNLVRIGAIGVFGADPLAPPQPKGEAACGPVAALVEFLRAPFDLELAPHDIGRALAERAFQLLDLDKLFRVQPLPLLREPAGKPEHRLALGLVRLLPRGLPAARLPGILVGGHAAERSAPRAQFERSLQGKTARANDAGARPGSLSPRPRASARGKTRPGRARPPPRSATSSWQ